MSFTEQLLKKNLIGSDLYGDTFCLEAMEKKKKTCFQVLIFYVAVLFRFDIGASKEKERFIMNSRLKKTVSIYTLNICLKFHGSSKSVVSVKIPC